MENGEAVDASQAGTKDPRDTRWQNRFSSLFLSLKYDERLRKIQYVCMKVPRYIERRNKREGTSHWEFTLTNNTFSA